MNIALILAGGTGTRLGGDIPKQYIEVAGKPIIAYCIDTFNKSKHIDAIWIVADKMWQEYIVNNVESEKIRGFSNVGANRQLSIYSGLCGIKDIIGDSDYVLIHDAARPMVSLEMIDDCFNAARGHDGAMPVITMKDTVYSSSNGRNIDGLLDRNKIFAGQSPEVFVYGKYLEANKALMPDRIMNINGSTEPAVMWGMDIVMFPGTEENFKITTKIDLEKFAAIIESS